MRNKLNANSTANGITNLCPKPLQRVSGLNKEDQETSVQTLHRMLKKIITKLPTSTLLLS